MDLDTEFQKLRDEIQALKDRVTVLEQLRASPSDAAQRVADSVATVVGDRLISRD